MKKSKKGLGVVGLGMLLIIVASGRFGYKTVRKLSPAVDERFGEIETQVTDTVEDTFGIDLTRLEQEDVLQDQNQNQDPVGDDPEPTVTVDNNQPQEVSPDAGQLLYQEMTGQKSYDYTY